MEENSLIVKNLNEVRTNSNTEINYYTNINDEKKIFNLESNVDYKLNDCVGEKIRVKEVLMKVFRKPLKTPEIDEETGEILKEYEYKKVTVLIDDNDKSYVTASKTFYNNFLKYLNIFGLENVENGIEIEIIKVEIKNSGNKALSFKLV